MPLNFECKAVSDSTVTLQWEPPFSDGGSSIQNYVLEMYEDKKGRKLDTEGTWKVIDANISFIQTSYIVQNLKESHFYFFRVSASNKLEKGEPAVLSKSIKVISHNRQHPYIP